MERQEPAFLDHGVPGPAQTTKDHEPEWVVYAQVNYEFRNNDNLAGKFAVSEERIVKRLQTYQKEGVRRTVVGVLLTHRFEFPHLLILQHTDSQKCILPSGKYKSWEKPRDILRNKLSKYLQKIEDTPKSKFASHQLSNIPSPSDLFNEVEIGEFIGEWWRTEFYTDPLPYLPPHLTRPKERLRVYQVTLPSKCLFSLPPGFTLKALPLFDLESAQYGQAIGGIPHLLCRFKLHYMVEGEIERSTYVDTTATSPRSRQRIVQSTTNKLRSQGPRGTSITTASRSDMPDTAISGSEIGPDSMIDSCIDDWIVSNVSEDEGNGDMPETNNITQLPDADGVSSQEQRDDRKESLPDELADIILEDR